MLDLNKIRFFGRHITKDNKPYFSYSGTGFEFNVVPEAKYVTVNISLLSELREHQYQYIAIYVNGTFYKKFQLKEGPNDVKFFVFTEEDINVKLLKYNETYVSSLYLEDITLINAKMGELKPENKKRIGFFGDSITCGYGNTERHGEGFTMEHEEFDRAYPFLIAQKLDMDYMVVARSGVSVSRQIWIDQLFDEIYDTVDMFNKCPVDDRLDYAIIALGTNDNGAYALAPEEEKPAALKKFVYDYLSLIGRIIKDNPGVSIVIAYNFVELLEDIKNAFKEIVECASKKYKNSIKLVELTPNAEGAAGHPYLDGHLVFAKEIINAMK